MLSLPSTLKPIGKPLSPRTQVSSSAYQDLLSILGRVGVAEGAPCRVAPLRAAARQLLAGYPTAALDARVLLGHVLGCGPAALIAADQEEVGLEPLTAFAALLDRRRRGEPVAYLTGEQEFFGRDFHVTPAVLIPRPETELLVEAALRPLPHGGRLLDLGTGSGCIAVTILAERPDSRGEAIDLSAEALAVARINARRHGVEGRLGLAPVPFEAAPSGPFDLILSNPPYIPDDQSLPTSVESYEPRQALRAGADGLDAYRVLGPVIAQRLAPQGTALLEIGADQAAAVTALLRRSFPVHQVSVKRDLAGLDRMVTITPL
ncbi:modification methylase, HemK family protein [Parvularcula bermudensis HTCC2503]|uniref:Release factor glutamine methyltransferase n=1 Tax=Parvularcula bermudensis (strain ATCC BAA-594 / HTCC2503 / KCTC 12087) TaxID=314260 RepID=E0TEW8_PARBH|nr:modification methylase, HemK family protein [Parvularcula bermudensis HTCC2503]